MLSAVTAGANGIQKSRALIASLITRTTTGSEGLARIDRLPRARAPNSSRPLKRATTFPSANRRATRGSIGIS